MKYGIKARKLEKLMREGVCVVMFSFSVYGIF